MRTALTTLALIAAVSTAHAWDYLQGQDTLRDTKWAALAAHDGEISLGWKCWVGEGLQITRVVVGLNNFTTVFDVEGPTSGASKFKARCGL